MLAEYLEINHGMISHIMSSPPAEAYYYGGKLFLFVAPFIMSSYLLLLNYLKIYRYFWGYILIIRLHSLSYIIFREGFFMHALTPVYLMLSWYLWITYLEWNNKCQLFKNSAVSSKRNFFSRLRQNFRECVKPQMKIQIPNRPGINRY